MPRQDCPSRSTECQNAESKGRLRFLFPKELLQRPESEYTIPPMTETTWHSSPPDDHDVVQSDNLHMALAFSSPLRNDPYRPAAQFPAGFLDTCSGRRPTKWRRRGCSPYPRPRGRHPAMRPLSPLPFQGEIHNPGIPNRPRAAVLMSS